MARSTGHTGGILTFGGSNPDNQPIGELNAVTVAADGTITAAGSSGRFGLVLRLSPAGLPAGFGATYHALGDAVTLQGVALDGPRTFVAGATSAPEQLLLGGLDAAGAPGAGLGLRAFGAPANGTARGFAFAPDGGLLTAGGLSNATAYVSRHLPNAAPVVSLAVPAQVRAGAPVTIDAAGTTDPEGEPLAYAFDLDGDGTYEFPGGDNPLALRSYTTPGTYRSACGRPTRTAPPPPRRAPSP